MKLAGFAALAGSAVLGAGLAAGCGTAAAAPKPAPTVTVTHTHTRIVHARPTKSPAASPAAAPTPAVAAPAANAGAVVGQFYQDITNHDYATAWALGGANVSGGVGYSQWVAGYATTASITLGTSSEFNGTTVSAEIIAIQNDGTVQTYQGTYTVTNGVITAASVAQAS
jgi:hypothetical protein